MPPFSAIAIGASAGGVDALLEILPALQRECGVSVFVVVHLPREGPSRLVEIFANKCRLNVAEADDKQPIETGSIYFAPPDYHLLVDDGPCLSLSADELVHFSRPSLDVLFESAADVYGSTLLGCVLTGANSDGASGLAAVERAGGRTIVQTPASAVAKAMPLAALQAAPGSVSLGVAEIADLLATLRDGRFPIDAWGAQP
jgi:two-component system chemotaxis response regulator CheB